MSPPAPYTLKRVREMLGVSRAVLSGLIASGVVVPARGPRNQARFSFQDLMLLRTARGLQQAGIRPRKILQALERLRQELPTDATLTRLRLSAVGSEVAVRDRHGRLQAPNGQWLMAFDSELAEASVASLPTATFALQSPGPPDWFGCGEALEARSEDAQAEAAYRQAIASDPIDLRAYLNLGALLSESGRCVEAVAVYSSALMANGTSSLLHFNLAVALEGIGDVAEASAAYQRALAFDADLADAHYNLAGLLQGQGDRQGALRHLSAYRRLQGRGRR